ncbi:MAG TPA: CHAT domain-containing protein [Candidatus Sulfotelmatobacter sp.]
MSRMRSGRNAAQLVLLALPLFGLVVCTTRHDPQAAYDHARQLYRRGDIMAAAAEAKNGYKEFHRTSTEWAWKFRMLEADTLLWQGKGGDALILLASEPTPPSVGELAVRRLRIEGVAYDSLGKAEEARSRLRAAEQLCTASENSACADVFSTQGRMEMNRASFLSAHRFFERGLASARADNNRFLEADSFLNLSWSANEQTHFDEALDWANKARKISLEQHYADISQTALGDMGWAYYKLGDPEKAEQMFFDAEKEAERLHDRSDQGGWLATLGFVYLDARDFDAAEQAFRQALVLAKETNSRGDITDALSALAFAAEKTNKLDDARRYSDEALANANEDRNGREAVYPRLVQGRVAARLHDATSAESAFREVAQSQDTPVFLKWEAERSLARLYEDEKQNNPADREYQTALSTFETARSELKHEDSRLPFLTNAARIYDDYIHFLVAQGKTNQALQVAEYSRGRTLNEGLGILQKGSSFRLDPVNAQEIARRAGGTVLFYWLGEEQSYLWAITPQKIALFPLPPAAEIKTRVDRYRKAIIEQRESLTTASDDGGALYGMLVDPAKELLPKGVAPKSASLKNTAPTAGKSARSTPNSASGVPANAAKVFIIPDGTLNSLNFETLLVPALPHSGLPGAGSPGSGRPDSEPQPHYWIEDVTISSASSLRMLQAFHARRSNGAGNLLLFGDAVSPNADFPHLPEASVEMQRIEKHFLPAQEQVFAGDQASPPAYLASKPERFSYVHFVAHGTASRLNPLDSAIVLSKVGASKSGAEEDSFKLYARDIIQHPLRAELVTVSTCRSAGARAYSGEGLVGLSWAFVRAGAHNVIGALWDVSDASTPQLMDELYAGLKKGETPDAALRHAKLTLLRSSNFRKPFYWAPFQIYTGS